MHPFLKMSILITNFNGTDLLKFPEKNYIPGMIISNIDLVLLFLGIVLETLVIAAILRIRSKSVDNIFVLSLCIADLIFNLYMFPSIVIGLVAGGWATGRQGYSGRNCSTYLLFLGASFPPQSL